MANKTIYVSTKDEPLFEQAQVLAGEALSSVIARALREFVARNQAKEQGMKEISVKVGLPTSSREQRFVGAQVGKWQGVSDDKDWWMEAVIYRTQKGNWAVLLTTVAKAELLTHGSKHWMDWVDAPRRAELIVAGMVDELNDKTPSLLLDTIRDLAAKEDQPVEYLDI